MLQRDGAWSEENSFSVTISEQILACSERRDKRPVSPKGRKSLRAALEWKNVVDSQLCEQLLSPPCTSSVLFVKDERTREKMLIIPSINRLYETYSCPVIHNKYLKAVGLRFASLPIYAHKAKSRFDFDLSRAFKLMCCCLLDHNMCSLHHARSSSDIRVLVLTRPYKEKETHQLPPSLLNIPLD